MSDESEREIASRGIAALSRMSADNDRLLADNERMKTDLMLMRERASQLEGRLEQCETARDHYMRFSTELVVKLNDMQLIIADAIRNAKHAAFAPPKVPVPKTQVPDIDTKGIETLIKRLPGNGKSDNAAP